MQIAHGGFARDFAAQSETQTDGQLQPPWIYGAGGFQEGRIDLALPLPPGRLVHCVELSMVVRVV